MTKRFDLHVKSALSLSTLDFDLDVKAVSDAGVVEGYGSVFGGTPDSYGDVVEPGAFANSLVEHRKKGTAPLMFFGHKHNELTIGTWDDVAEDGKGLYVKGSLDLEDPIGMAVYRKLKRKEMRGLSIGYQTINAVPDENKRGVTRLKELDLWEVSIVNFPASKRAGVDKVKSEAAALAERLSVFGRHIRDGEPLPVKDFEDILREAGVPKAMATRIASVGYAKAIRSDSEGEAKLPDLSGLKAAIESFTLR